MLKTHCKGDSHTSKGTSTSIIFQGLTIKHALTCTSENCIQIQVHW